MPKLQAVCTMTAQDGMVVRTAQTSAKAAEGQNATLEFILVNHPLDCPVCDKGGECPLQDLTFRCGPRQHAHGVREAHAREADPDLAGDRARPRALHPLLPLHALLRGRRRGRPAGRAQPRRALADRHLRGPALPRALLRQRDRALPGRRADLHAVPLHGRPWEIQNVPTVCGLCPVGCNVHATMREGKVKRMLSRNHPQVDEGWLCDKGRFAYTHLYARDRISDPLRPSAQRAASRSSPGTTRSTRPSGCCARPRAGS